MQIAVYNDSGHCTYLGAAHSQAPIM
uniref:Uncharacterized protein n=1 Tax=Anguilla anguilla TaxID=7936 RepID=A0A0E9VTJ6_ANGAN